MKDIFRRLSPHPSRSRADSGASTGGKAKTPTVAHSGARGAEAPMLQKAVSVPDPRLRPGAHVAETQMPNPSHRLDVPVGPHGALPTEPAAQGVPGGSHFRGPAAEPPPKGTIFGHYLPGGSLMSSKPGGYGGVEAPIPAPSQSSQGHGGFVGRGSRSGADRPEMGSKPGDEEFGDSGVGSGGVRSLRKLSGELQWQYEDDKGGWQQYSDNHSQRIEQAYRLYRLGSGPDDMHLTEKIQEKGTGHLRDITWSIDFRRKTQFNLVTQKLRRIRREGPEPELFAEREPRTQPEHALSNDVPSASPSGGLGATPHELALANGGYRKQFAILNANQKLFRDRFATPGRIRVVQFVDGDLQNSTAMKVRDEVTKRRQQIPNQGVITLSESWTDEALRYLGDKYRSGRVKLAALSYANCTYIGGNYTDGGMTKAQEEELCRLFPAMFESLRQAGSQGEPGVEMISYKDHLFGARFEDGYSKARNVLFLEEITCMRNGAPMNYKLLQPKHQVDAGFIIAAAPLLGRGGDSSFTKWLHQPTEWYDKLFLNVFLAPKLVSPDYDVIVVGPFGCGAFGNDPTTVAQAFLTVIKKYELLHLYREIHFCLGRSTVRTVGGANVNNAEVFRRELGTSGIPCGDISRDLDRAVSNWDREERG